MSESGWNGGYVDENVSGRLSCAICGMRCFDCDGVGGCDRENGHGRGCNCDCWSVSGRVADHDVRGRASHGRENLS